MPTLPAGPSNIVWPFLRYVTDPHGAFPACARRYGDPFLLPMPGTPGTVVSGTPTGLKAIMTADPDTYESFRTDALDRMLGKYSLFLQSGPTHKAARRILAPAFHASRALAQGSMMAEATLKRTRDLRAGAVFDLAEVTQWISLELIIRAIFGATDEGAVERFHRTMADGLASITPAVLYFGWLRREFGGVGPWARAQRMFRDLMALLGEQIAARRARGSGGDDVLGMMLRARHPDGSGMSDLEIRDKLYDMAIAGYETSAVALTWAGYEICRHPEVRARLQGELDPLGAEPDPDALVALPYLEAICSETLRLHPNFVLLTRHLARPLEVDGYALPAGFNVSAAIGVAHFREETFPRARAFEPERFMGRTYSPFEYLPFGGGAQRCIGASYAMTQMKVVLGTLFRRYHLALRSDRPLRPTARAVTVGPLGRVEMVVLGERRAGPPSRARAGSPPAEHGDCPG